MSQVTNDLDRNLKEQDRITSEIASLQEQLTALQHDRSILLNMRQALGITAPADSAAVPSPRKKSGGTRRTEARKAAAGKAAAKPAAGKVAAGTAAAGTAAAASKPVAPNDPEAAKAKAKAGSETSQPTLIELVRRHLAEQSEPRSAAEVAEALGRAHPDRGVQTKVVRTTLENLVARNLAHRSKQGSSVFYTVPDESTREKPEDTDTTE
ncbi:hypothetical protein AB0B40_11790 [Streptomyces sp. NPDC042638]|uniref:hypothetical protein n=1 Tax=Streptomyces sp. NPDC042638 TaxID=3154333 RepID=UPI0033C347FF